MVSSVTEGHIKRIRKAEYLSNDIAHRLPEKGQLIPTPRPHERVVFLPHFLCGLGFPLHPFVWGLMFYNKFNKTFPKSSQRFHLAQTLIKHNNTTKTEAR